MVAGDKNETAVNIGFSCRLLNDNMLPLIELTSASPEDLDTELTRALQEMNASEANHDLKSKRQWGVVLEGRAIATVFDSNAPEGLLDKLVQVPSSWERE